MNTPFDELLHHSPYSFPDPNKNQLLLAAAIPQLSQAIRHNPAIKKLFNTQNIKPRQLQSLDDIPFIPVTMFKYFNLRSTQKSSIIKTILSSGTTTSTPSKVPLDSQTSFNQMKALNHTLSHYITTKRPFLVIDHPGSNTTSKSITTRSAAIRGLSLLSSEIIYLLSETSDGQLVLNDQAFTLMQKYRHTPVYVFGFTYIIWSQFMKLIAASTTPIPKFSDILIFHTGGWKKLHELKISELTFSRQLARVFHTSPKSVRNFYGMAEQTGIIFVDCNFGYKHVPNFAQIIIRDPQTLQPAPNGQVGLIEIISILGHSYYSQGVLTEDLGQIIGIDDCRCGRKGTYFSVLSRVESAELRGCGDTFQEKI